MTRRLLTLTCLTGALLFSGVAADTPAPAAGAAVLPPRPAAPADVPTFDVQMGDGVIQIRIRSCEACRTEVAVRIELGPLAAAFVAR
jgi:hypothetical protein